MNLTTSDNIALVSAVFAFLAVIVSLIAWRYPISPKKTKIPEYTDHISPQTADVFIDFLQNNIEKIVRFRTYVSLEDEDILNIGESGDGERYATIGLSRQNFADGGYAGIELSINPEKGNKEAPVIFANGAYHINGYFIVQQHPGIFQGYVGMSVTEVSAEQMAFRA